MAEAAGFYDYWESGSRATLADTERRVRLLLDRCQEISGAVNLISHLTERTHILALNASMHASAVGDAGRSFRAVADVGRGGG